MLRSGRTIVTSIEPSSPMLPRQFEPIHPELMLETECRWGLCCPDAVLSWEESDSSFEGGGQAEAADEPDIDETPVDGAVDGTGGCGSDVWR